LFDEAVGEFEKRFIKRVLDRVEGNQSRAPRGADPGYSPEHAEPQNRRI